MKSCLLSMFSKCCLLTAASFLLIGAFMLVASGVLFLWKHFHFPGAGHIVLVWWRVWVGLIDIGLGLLLAGVALLIAWLDRRDMDINEGKG